MSRNLRIHQKYPKRRRKIARRFCLKIIVLTNSQTQNVGCLSMRGPTIEKRKIKKVLAKEHKALSAKRKYPYFCCLSIRFHFHLGPKSSPPQSQLLLPKAHDNSDQHKRRRRREAKNKIVAFIYKIYYTTLCKMIKNINIYSD